jgi:hypothetical protein
LANQFALLTKQARAQVTRRSVDASELTVTVNGTVVHITGVIRPLRSQPNVDLKSEMELISQSLRQRSGISDVVWDVVQRL